MTWSVKCYRAPESFSPVPIVRKGLLESAHNPSAVEGRVDREVEQVQGEQCWLKSACELTWYSDGGQCCQTHRVHTPPQDCTDGVQSRVAFYSAIVYWKSLGF